MLDTTNHDGIAVTANIAPQSPEHRSEAMERSLAERSDGNADGTMSEVERLAAHADLHCTAIAPDWPALLAGAPEMGRVRTVARNAHAIHKSWGSYGSVRGGKGVGLVINGGIDLRMFYGAWKHAYIVEAAGDAGPRISLEIFDGAGDAVQKVFPETADGRAVLASWAQRHGIAAARPQVTRPAPPAAERADGAIDAGALLAEWQALRDVHQFRAMIERHGATRTQSLRLARGRFATRTGNSALARVLQAAHERAIPVMVFLANRGIVQIHSGTVGAARRENGWLHLNDPGFHLHVREAGIAESWVVTKPTDDGPVTSLELYDTAGEAVLQMFGVRQEGSRENPAWQELAHAVAVAS